MDPPGRHERAATRTALLWAGVRSGWGNRINCHHSDARARSSDGDVQGAAADRVIA